MLPGQIQGDAKFTAFQVKLAASVISARASGVTISNRFDPGCRCPLGSHPLSTGHHPPSLQAAREGWEEVAVSDLSAFIRGYSKDDVAVESPYFDLGKAYAEQFP